MSDEALEGLRPKLERAHETLQLALDQACNADLDEADTGELIRLEEVLAIANEAAKEAVSVRRRLKRPRTAEHPLPSGGTATHREVEDAQGVRWLIFAVYPSPDTAQRASLREPYRSGWLAFDCGLETRRVAPVPENWTSLPDADLIALIATAEVAPRRTKPRREPPQDQPG
jgi:hypothetical protein